VVSQPHRASRGGDLIEGETRQLRARTVSALEKAELWPQILGAYKGYGGYQGKTARDIPVVICEP